MPSQPTHMIVDVRPGERVALSGGVSVELVKKSGQLARLRITAPQDVKIEKKSGECLETTSHLKSA